MAENHIRRSVLIVEDEPVNREILGMVLRDTCEVSYASTGAEGLEAIRAQMPDLLLLDLNLPDIHGMDILDTMNAEGILERLPVIVLTSDREAEVASLDNGAVDFISKPYPKSDVILARVRRALNLTEGRATGEPDRDALTGLYNRECFYRYAEHLDARFPERPMDAIVININHFHMINERYGKAYADEVLHRIGERLSGLFGGADSLACRREADTFLIYTPHRSDYTDVLDIVSDGAAGSGVADNVVRMRMGVYPRAAKDIDVERRFDRAKLAADTVRSTFTKAVAIYDSALHESAIFAEQLLIDFPTAIREKQFKVYYQPKYDVRGDVPLLNSAEALVRWDHPEFGMISPGVFIPLFEKSGLIQQLDSYVWREAAAQMRDWRDRLGVSVPVSVNVSRMDMYDPALIENVNALVDEFGLTRRQMMLEVTESAYTEDSGHIIRTVNDFRKLGFFIEMDDFGSGYSSLNMLSNLPIDALKLDMQFIRSAFKNGKNTRMLEIVIEIAASLDVPVIAEGVETAEQLFTLKAMGCDIVQGYYFSKPVPADKFEAFLMDNVEEAPAGAKVTRGRQVAHDRHTYAAMHDPLTGLYNGSAFDILFHDMDSQHSAVLLAHMDGFADVRDQALSNAMVLRAAASLRSCFRSSDCVCRTAEDEFAVIITRVVSTQKPIILQKARDLAEMLQQSPNGAPAVSLSVGIAFGDRENPGGDIFQDADAALVRARAAGPGKCVVY